MLKGYLMGMNLLCANRHVGQNRIAHDVIQKGRAKHFRMIPSAPNQGFYYGFRRSNLFTTW